MRAWLVLLAVVSVLLGAWLQGARLEGYSHLRHALGVLGARGMPAAGVANALLFLLPGVLLAINQWRLRGRLRQGAGWWLRMALQTGLLAALAYALQGVFVLDLAQVADEAGNRLHALAWMLWQLAWALSALLLVVARELPRSLRLGALLLASCVPLLMLGAPALWPPGLAQRLGVAAWLVLCAWLTQVLSRGAASTAG
ncbi:DUF998 domain-containing protein [Luteimonas sp. e5]